MQYFQNLQQKPLQYLMMTPQMQQALHVLQLPVLELAAWVELQLEQNPLIECQSSQESFKEEHADSAVQEKELIFSDNDFSLLSSWEEDYGVNLIDESSSPISKDEQDRWTFRQHLIPAQSSLFEHLMQQAREVFQQQEELYYAEILIGSLDTAGFLYLSLEQMAQEVKTSSSILETILQTIQTFIPFGVGARSLQESFLIQLRCQNKSDSLAAQIVSHYFDDLIHHRIPLIQKGLKRSAEEIHQAIQSDLSHLDFHPGLTWQETFNQVLIPDIFLQLEGDQIRLTFHEGFLPKTRLNPTYLSMLKNPETSKETKVFIKEKIRAAQWLMQAIQQRQNTLQRITEALVKYQMPFFLDAAAQLKPLTMHVLAQELEIHESTVARAIANKYLSCSSGIYSLRFFFSTSLSAQDGVVSSQGVGQLVKKWIHQEDKKHPLSDAALSLKLKEKGIDCARRTIAKYRSQLQIGNAHQRRKF